MAPTVTEMSVVLDQSVFDGRKRHVAAKANYPKCAPEFMVDIQVDLPPERPGQSAPAAVPAIFVDDTQERPHPTTCQSRDLDSRRAETSQRAPPQWELAARAALIGLFVRPSTCRSSVHNSEDESYIIEDDTLLSLGPSERSQPQSAGAEIVAEVRADEVGRGHAERLETHTAPRLPPQPMVRVPEHDVPRSAFPVIDAHNHLGRPPETSSQDTSARVGVAGRSRTSAGWWPYGRSQCRNDRQSRRLLGYTLEANLDRYDRSHPGRFVTFCRLDWQECSQSGWPDRLAKSLRDSASRGACGLKVWKNLGLWAHDENG